MNQVTQLDVVMPNEPGSMLKICEKLRENNINIEAMFCSEGSKKSIMHLIVDKLAEANAVLQSLGEITESPVFSFEMRNQPGAIESIAKMCSDADININNVYCSCDGDYVMIYLSVDDPETFRNLYSPSIEP